MVDGDMHSTVRAEYVRAVEGAGGCAIMLPYTKDEGVIERFISLCDGFIFAGGADIEPERYGEEKREVCGTTTPYRDEVELLAFPKIFASGKPIVGICRGCQLINVALGGTLYQDLPSELGTGDTHREPDRSLTASHSAVLTKESRLCAELGRDRIEINSLHHQAIKRLGDGLVPTVFADDGVIEGAIHATHPYLCIYQWYPERMCDGDVGRTIFDAFISEAAKERKL